MKNRIKTSKLVLLICLLNFQLLMAQNNFVITNDGHTARINEVIFNTNQDEIITVSDDKSLAIWNIEKQKLVKRYFSKQESDDNGKLYSVALNKEGTQIVAAGANRLSDNTYGFILIDKDTEEEIVYSAHKKPIVKLKFSRDGKYLITASQDSTIKIWNYTSDTIQLLNTFHQNNVIVDFDVAYHANSLVFTTGTKSIFTISDFLIKDKNTIVETKKHFHPVNCVGYSPDSLWILSGGDDFILNKYTNKGDFTKTLYKSNAPILDMTFSYDGQNVVIAHENSEQIICLTIKKGSVISTYTEFDNTVQSVCFSPQSIKGIYVVVAVGGNNHEIRIFSAINGKTIRVLSEISSSIQHIYFKDNFTLQFATNKNQNYFKKEIDLNTATIKTVVGEKINDEEKSLIKKYRISKYALKYKNKLIVDSLNPLNRIHCMQILSSGILIGTDKGILFFGNDGKLITRLQGLNSTIRSIAVSPNKNWVVAGGDEQKIVFWAADSLGKLNVDYAYTAYLNNANDWLIWSSTGFFSGSNNSDMLLSWQINKDSKGLAKLNSLNSFSDALYRPELVSKGFLQNGITPELEKSAGISKVDLQLLYRASPPKFQKPSVLAYGERRPLIEKTQNSYVSDSTEIMLKVKVKYGGGGISELNILHNGKLLVVDKEFTLSNYKEEVLKEYKIRLLTGKNEFKVFTLNSRKMRSPSDELEVLCTSALSSATNLHLLVIGISEYKNKNLNLNYGKADAVAIKEGILKNGKSIFKNTFVYELYNNDATLDKIKTKIAEIKSKSQLNDVFMLFYAGHGEVLINDQTESSEFYMVLNDVTTGKEGLKYKGLSSKEMKEMLTEIPANKQIVLIDACHSEASFKNTGMARRGMGEQQAIYQLARSSGTVIIAACGSDQTAKEFTDFGHGAFTYSFLEALEGKADGGMMDKKITVNEIKAYIEDRVPQLTQKYSGTAQYPSGYSVGHDFPLGVVK